MAGHPISSALMRAILTIKETDYIDEGWIRSHLHEALSEAKFEQGFWGRLFRRRPYNISTAKLVAGAIADRSLQSETSIRTRLELAITSQPVEDVILDALSEAGFLASGLPLSAFSRQRMDAIFASALYRFTYGRSDGIEIEQFLRTADYAGVYRLFVKDRDEAPIDCRILVLSFENGADRLSAIEIQRERAGFKVRSGPIVPSEDRYTYLLSARIDFQKTQQALNTHCEDVSAVLEKLGISAETAESLYERVLQSHELAFYELANEGEETSGRYLHSQEFGLVSGTRIPGLTDEILDSVGPITPEDQDKLDPFDRRLIKRLDARYEALSSNRQRASASDGDETSD